MLTLVEENATDIGHVRLEQREEEGDNTWAQASVNESIAKIKWY
ncbi:hypothetical protein SETIT_6G032100v2 [Setaria italica]|uniref:Uncharacterized protein n=1 Tax=Setaria italica TaxID=4555 RepID=A0A368RHJ6_SETIT|nr:hypothetical protein SETIT_6G032100v2 [Setaria italica]